MLDLGAAAFLEQPLLERVEEEGFPRAPPVVRVLHDVCCRRADVLQYLVAELAATRPVRVVEVGVYWGLTSYMVGTGQHPVDYVGVDPYFELTQSLSGKNNSGELPALTWNWNLHPKSEESLDVESFLISMAPFAAQRVFDHIGGRLLAQTSFEAAEQFADGSVDIVFVDGLHVEHSIKEDLAAWEPKVRKGGFVAGHDFSMDWSDVIEAVTALRAGKELTLAADFTYFWRVE